MIPPSITLGRSSMLIDRATAPQQPLQHLLPGAAVLASCQDSTARLPFASDNWYTAGWFVWMYQVYHTTRLTCKREMSINSAQLFVPVSQTAYLKEAFQPPHLENSLPDQYAQLEHTPPLHPRVRALSCIPVRPLSNHDIRLLILDLREDIG